MKAVRRKKTLRFENVVSSATFPNISFAFYMMRRRLTLHNSGFYLYIHREYSRYKQDVQ